MNAFYDLFDAISYPADEGGFTQNGPLNTQSGEKLPATIELTLQKKSICSFLSETSINDHLTKPADLAGIRRDPVGNTR